MAVVSAQEQICAYCGRGGDAAAFSDEHVLPQALGGTLEPTNPFRIRTHRRCNSLCGTWVDAPFIRSWLIQNARALASHHFVDPTCEPIMPMFCLGRADGFEQNGQICDLWVGPTGDHVYHFHRPYPVSPSIVGRPSWITREELDAGVVFVRVVGTNTAWHPIITASVRSAFSRAPRYYLNVSYQGEGPPYPPIPGEYAPLVEWIDSLPADGQRQGSVSVDPECDHRFLAKLALGFGAIVLGDAFIRSTYAARLHAALWERDIANWPDGVRGTPFLRRRPQSFDLLDWNGCHVLVVQEFREPSTGEVALGLTVSLYGTHSASIMISDEPSLWDGRALNDGMVWVVAPGLRSFAGPTSLPEYMTERLHGPGEALGPLLLRIESSTMLPPFHVGQEPIDSRHNRIAVAAYYLWLRRGGQPDPDAALDDWLTAEREVIAADTLEGPID